MIFSGTAQEYLPLPRWQERVRVRAVTLLLTVCFLHPGITCAQQLTVSAASSLTGAVNNIVQRFEAAHPGVTVRLNVAGSGLLVQQIIAGAPVDVFISADTQTLQRGIAQGVLDAATRRDIARNTLVLITPENSNINTLAALTQPHVQRIAIGKPASVPAGRYAQQALQAANVWQAVQPKLVYADNVRQALDYVARGEVQAGVVYATDAQLLPGKLRVAATLAGYEAIVYPAIAVRGSRQAALAQRFIAFLQATAAQEILQAQGFAAP
jgi:molybdate transport system substrate-binding protein